MTRDDRTRMDDVLASAEAIAEYVRRGSLDDSMVFDAVRIRLLEIGEAVKAVSPEVLAQEPSIPWREVTGLRDVLAHRYFDTAHGVIDEVVHHDLPALVAATRRLRASLDRSGPRSG